MEISRQRRRAGVLQATSDKCEACDGTGRRRSIPSAALQLLRAVEARAAGGGLRGMTVTAPTDVALYLLNSKRDSITAIEDEAGFTIAIKSSGEMIPGDFQIDADKASSGRRRRKKFNREEFLEGDADDHLLPDAEEDEDEDEVETSAATSEEDGEESGGRRKRRRRGRRGGRRRRRDGEAMDPGAPPSDGGALLDGLAMSITHLLGDEPDELPEASEGGLDAKPVAMPEARSADTESGPKEVRSEDGDSDEEPKEGKKRRRRRRRRRRGGEGDGESTPDTADAEVTETPEASDDAPSEAPAPVEEAPITALEPEPAPETEPAPEPEPTAEAEPEPEPAPEPAPDPEPVPEPALAETAPTPITTEPVLETSTKPKKKKRGWWSR